MTTYTAQQIEAIGGKTWTSRDGRITRVYINSSIFARLMGLEVQRYNTGNIRNAEINGEHISNAEAGRILASKVYLEDGRLHIQTMSSWNEDTIADAIARAVADLDKNDEDDQGDEDDDQGDASSAAGQVTALRKARRTVREIAHMVGVSISTIYRWARGICRPRPANAAALATLA